jgi:hypothetical protein
MTIATQASSVTAQGNNATTIWTYSFLIPGTSSTDKSNVTVTLTDNTVAPGTATTLSGGTYSITGVNSPTGGTLTYPLVGSPISTNQYITISRSIPYVQNTTISNQGSFYPTAVDAALDYEMMGIQQINNTLSQCIQIPIGSTTTPATLIATITSASSAATTAAATATTQAGIATTQAGTATTQAGNAAASAAAAAAAVGGVKISSGDTTADKLQTKLPAGTGITLTKGNAGANEILTVAIDTAVVPRLGVAAAYTAQHTPTGYGLTSASTIAFDNALCAYATVTLGVSATLGDPANKADGQAGEIVVTGSSSYTLGVHANWKMADGTAVALTPAAGKKTWIWWECNGTYNYITKITQEA